MYKYELHLHTSEVSKCGRTSAVKMVDFYKSVGYTGVFITDHFFNGNTNVDTKQSWSKMISDYMVGYYNAKKRGEEIGLDVFFGIEYSYHGTDVLVYGLDEKWLLQHPFIMQMRTTEFCDYVRSEGALVIHAHPYREAAYINMIRLFPRNVDGVEIFNACRTDFENDRAKEYADNYNLLYSAGTDNHIGLRERVGGMEFEERIKDEKDLIAKIKNNQGKIFEIDCSQMLNK